MSGSVESTLTVDRDSFVLECFTPCTINFLVNDPYIKPAAAGVECTSRPSTSGSASTIDLTLTETRPPEPPRPRPPRFFTGYPQGGHRPAADSIKEQRTRCVRVPHTEEASVLDDAST